MVQVRYDRGFREYYYKNTQDWLPSVTSILNLQEKPYLRQWRKQFTEEQIAMILRYTSIRGKLIHFNVLQKYADDCLTCSQELPDIENMEALTKNKQMQDELAIALALFKQFQQMYTLEATSIERTVYNIAMGYAGTVDFQGYLIEGDEKIKILMDIKTSKEVYRDSVSLQLTAYNVAVNEWADRLYCLLLHPGLSQVEGIRIGWDYPYWSFVRLYSDWEGFAQALGNWNHYKYQKDL